MDMRRYKLEHAVVVSDGLSEGGAGFIIHGVQVRGLVGEPTEDLIVETTLDLPIQVSAEQALRAGVAGARGQGVQQGALVALDGEGRVRAYVGGVDYEESQFDRAAMARRQAGSAFKPFVRLLRFLNLLSALLRK